MALVVEDGTGMATAESYLSVADFKTYVAARGLAFVAPTRATNWVAVAVDADVEAALRRATEHLEVTYSTRWLGTRVLAEQALSWPRRGVPVPDSVLGGNLAGAYYSAGPKLGYGYRRPGYGGYPYMGGTYIGGVLGDGAGFLPSDELPARVTSATAQAAVRELATPGMLLPDYVRSERITSETVGPISTTYASSRGTSDVVPRIAAIEDGLAPLLSDAGGASLLLRRA